MATRLEQKMAALKAVGKKGIFIYITVGAPDFETSIRAVKEAVSVPVIGNGDIRSAEDAASMLRETGCDGVMIARGAQGNPWLFREIRQYLETGTVPAPPTCEERHEMIRRHLAMQIEMDGPHMGLLKMRSHISWYLHGFPNAAALRNAVNTAETREALEEILEEAFSQVFCR